MEGMLFLVFLVAMIVIVHWAWKNDAVSMTGKTSGLLQMRVFDEQRDPEVARSSGAGKAGTPATADRALPSRRAKA